MAATPNPDAKFPNLETIVARSSTFSPVVSLVNPSLLPESAKALVTHVSSGMRCFALYARYSPFGFWERTSGGSYPLMEVEPSEPSSMTWPKWGIAWDGACMELAMSVPRIVVSESSLLPTPRANKIGGVSSEGWRPTLEQTVKMYPTPQAFDAKDVPGGNSEERHKKGGCRNLAQEVGGQLNPQWVEWLMGLPIGWTDLGHSETP
jgi:hypothetical protein